MRDRDFLIWIYERLVTHGDTENTDFMSKFRSIIAAIPWDRATLNTGSYCGTIEELKKKSPPARCDDCDCMTTLDDLKPIPVNAACLRLNLCSKCREQSGWTEEKRLKALAAQRIILGGCSGDIHGPLCRCRK